MTDADPPPTSGRVLALDVGERRIGLAISDPDGRLAVPLETLERSAEAADLSAIQAVAAREDVSTLLVGLPLSLSGAVGPQARIAQEFARRLSAAQPLPVETWDERLSTVEASRRSRDVRRPGPRSRHRQSRGRTAGAARASVDSLAAAVFLQSYLDSRRRPPA